MFKHLSAPASILLASALLAAPAAAGPKWVDIGKAQLPTFGSGEIYIGAVSRNRSDVVSARLHAVLDEDWQEPLHPGDFGDIYFNLLADCRAGTVAVHSTWPEGPDESVISPDALRPPTPGSAEEMLLKAACARAG